MDDKQNGGDYRTESVRKLGRPKGSTKPTSSRQVAEHIGVPASTIRDAERHVDAVRRYPFLKGGKKYEVIKAAKAIDKYPVLAHFSGKPKEYTMFADRLDRMSDEERAAYLDRLATES